ncbi:3'-5' exonuclease [Marinitoga lauensis]|uniref:3'-5' exonuclease n=1 Tax=Marinitoga lauensis TaxID=2201189 RepID=UPI0019816319|nr:3'-5' exonuclease [Marinitoga lauensis]
MKNKKNILTFLTEKDMLIYFSKLVMNEKPDIITGWFSNGFDIPYIINRANYYRINITAIPNLKHNSYQRNGKYFNSIPGVNLIDFLEIYRRYVLDKPASYKLDIVAKHHHIEGKTEIKGYNYYQSDIEKFIDYAIRDVEILVELEKKLKLIGLICSLQALIRVPFPILFGTSNSIEHYIQQYIMKDKITFRFYERGNYGLHVSGLLY